MTKKAINFIIDFDSTFIQVEAFDELCKLCYTIEEERNLVLEKVKAITNRGMNGELSITDSLKFRLLLLNAHKHHLPALIAVLQNKVSDSFRRNKEFLETNRDSIFIVSNGFSEFILPVVLDYGIRRENVFANSFIYNEKGNIIGFDQENVLASAKGKVKLVSQLDLEGDSVMIGDGYTDYEVHEAGLSARFYAFTENVTRENVVAKTEHVANSFDRIIGDFLEKMDPLIEITNSLKKS